MTILLNDVEHQLSDGSMVSDLIDENAFTGNVAVAVNNSIVRREAWTTTPLHDGDDVVIITAAYGG